MAIKFLNTATAATQAVGDNSTKIATTAYADAAASAIPIGNYLPLSAGASKPLTGGLHIPHYIYHAGDTGTHIGYPSVGRFTIATGTATRVDVTNAGLSLGDYQTNVSVSTILDEDDMASDSATALVTQQSIKTYVDAQTGNTPNGSNIYTMPTITGTATWVLLGRFTANNGGQSVFIKMVTNSGYNSTIDQNTEVYIRFKTSNGSSVDANGFSGDSSFYTIGANAGYTGGNIKWVSNAAGASATSYELYIKMPTYSGNGSFYSVENTVGTWTPLNNAATDPGAASSTIMLPIKQFKVGGSDLVVGGGGANSYFANSNVGIGTTGGNAKLEVAGDVLIDSGEYLSWGTAGATSIEGSTASNKLQFRTSSTDRMIINDTGVGIGTAIPDQKLHIKGGDIQTQDTTGLNGVLRIRATITGTPSTGGYPNVGAGDAVIEGGGTTQRKPGVITLMNGDSTISAGQDLGVIQFVGKDDSATGYCTSQIISTTSGTGGSGASGGGILRFLTSSGNTGSAVEERMRINNSGRVMIGTTTSTSNANLTVKDSLAIQNGSNTILSIFTGYGSSFINTGTSGGTVRFGAPTSYTTNVYVQGTIEAVSSVQMGNNTAAASAANAGSTRYRVSGNNSYMDMSMRTGSTTYAWVNIVQNNW